MGRALVLAAGWPFVYPWVHHCLHVCGGTHGWPFGFEQMQEALSIDGVLLALELLEEGTTVFGGAGPFHSPLSI